MTSWKNFTEQAPELAAFGKTRFQRTVAYLGTLRADGGPRVHPVTPIIGEQLFLFMEPTSPKRNDLLRDPRFTLHCGVEDNSGGGGEFDVRGRATLNDDPLALYLWNTQNLYALDKRVSGWKPHPRSYLVATGTTVQ